jgi:hypothetical protein
MIINFLENEKLTKDSQCANNTSIHMIQSITWVTVLGFIDSLQYREKYE